MDNMQSAGFCKPLGSSGSTEHSVYRVRTAHLCVEVGGQGSRALHDLQHMRALALVRRDDADLPRLHARAHEVRDNLLNCRRLCRGHCMVRSRSNTPMAWLPTLVER